MQIVFGLITENFSEHAVDTLLPRRQPQAEDLLEFLRRQARVVRAPGRRREGAGGHRVDGLDLEFAALLAGLLDDEARVAVPAGLAGGHRVVDAGEVDLAVHGLARHLRGQVGQQVRAGGCADLVVDDGQAFTLGRQAQHGLGEVAATRGVDPAGAQDQVPAAAGADELLALQLGLAVDAQGAGGGLLVAGSIARAVEDIVGAVVHQPGAGLGRAARQHARGGGVDRARQLGLALGLVDRGMRRGVDDQVRLDRRDRGRQRLGPAEVAVQLRAVMVEPDHLAQRRQRALQLPPDLPALAQKKDLHVCGPRRQSRAL